MPPRAISPNNSYCPRHRGPARRPLPSSFRLASSPEGPNVALVSCLVGGVVDRAVDLKQLPEVLAPLREAPVPLGDGRLLPQLFANDEFGVNDLQGGIGVQRHGGKGDEQRFGRAGVAGPQAAIQLGTGLPALSPRKVFRQLRIEHRCNLSRVDEWEEEHQERSRPAAGHNRRGLDP